MSSTEGDYCVLECGEDELDECQKIFYNSDHCRNLGWESGTNTQPINPASLSLGDLLSQPVSKPPYSKSLVVLGPEALNQKAANNAYLAANSATGNDHLMRFSGHIMPALAPSKPVDSRSTTAAGISLTTLLNDGTRPMRGQDMRLAVPSTRFNGARLPPTPHSVPTLPQTRPPVRQKTHPARQYPPQASSQISVFPRASNSNAPSIFLSSPIRLESNSVRPSQEGVLTIKVPGSRELNPACRPPFHPSPRMQMMPPSSDINGVTPPRGRDYCTSDAMQINSSRPRNNCEATNSSNFQFYSPPTPQTTIQNSAPSPSLNMPLLPETRPEIASDTRPRPRPGPASRKRNLPPVPSSSCDTNCGLVDLTEDDQTQVPSKKAISRDKTFPSLIVTARASLKIFPPALVNNERVLMDTQIRKVMHMEPSAFTKFLLHEMLLKSEQFCREHKKPLKLVVNFEKCPFPSSGGYMWIAECCDGITSIYASSIFDKTLQTPNVVLKLMYHWACNTSVPNVLNWVKVDSYIMKTYHTYFRAICTAAVHQKFSMLGGNHKKVQVGVISIGTFADGTSQEIKVDIMAVMDPESSVIRLKVLENFLSESNRVYESKFRKILEVLKGWVHPNSTLITDFDVDMALCLEYGFPNLVVSGGKHSANNNSAVVDYIKAKIPNMFQNTLGMLSLVIIQQFLDELVWRETWGPYPSRAYDSLVKHLAEFIKLPGPDMITKLKMIASDPFKDWRYSVWENDAKRAGSTSVTDSVQTTIDEVLTSGSALCEITGNRISAEETMKTINSSEEEANRKDTNGLMDIPTSSVDSACVGPNDKVFIEPFYYGTVEGDPTLQKLSGAFLAGCVLCKADFLTASAFTNHLIHHAVKSSVATLPFSKPWTVCTLCCRKVVNIDSHKKQFHPPAPYSLINYRCKICHLNLQTEEKVVRHMNLVHQELDMPYKCDICHYQTSIYDLAAVHFKLFHDKDYCLRCPYCFKTVRFCSKNGIQIPQNQYYFIQHVQKHGVSQLNRKCEKCVLSFTNMATLKQHQERRHIRSGKFLNNVKRLTNVHQHPSRMLMMSIPTQPPLPPVTLHEDSFHTLKGETLSSPVVLPEYYAVCSCLECDGPMTRNHFTVKMTCTRCSFQSCCANSIREHSARFHSSADNSSGSHSVRQLIGGSAALSESLNCSYCTFSSKNGNKMADHLATCGDGGAFAAPIVRKKHKAKVRKRVKSTFLSVKT